jgi:hypothetical protein
VILWQYNATCRIDEIFDGNHEFLEVFEGPVAATKKEPEPNWTQPQATSLSGCSWASLLMVTVAVA